MRSKNRKWKLGHWFTVGDYLKRLYLFETPWCSVWLQRIGGPDPSNDLHDHPLTFFSLILWGRYVEDMEAGPDELFSTYSKFRAWFNFKRAEDRHRIVWTYGKPVYTLLFCGPRRREWGFIVDGQWVHFTKHESFKGEA